MKYLPLVVEFHPPSTRADAETWFEAFTRSRNGARPYRYRTNAGEAQPPFRLVGDDAPFQVMGGANGDEFWSHTHIAAAAEAVEVLSLDKWAAERNQEVRASLAAGLRATALLPGMVLLVAQDLFTMITAAAPPRTKRSYIWVSLDRHMPGQTAGGAKAPAILLLSGQTAFAY